MCARNVHRVGRRNGKNTKSVVKIKKNKRRPVVHTTELLLFLSVGERKKEKDRVRKIWPSSALYTSAIYQQYYSAIYGRWRSPSSSWRQASCVHVLVVTNAVAAPHNIIHPMGLIDDRLCTFDRFSSLPLISAPIRFFLYLPPPFSFVLYHEYVSVCVCVRVFVVYISVCLVSKTHKSPCEYIIYVCVVGGIRFKYYPFQVGLTYTVRVESCARCVVCIWSSLFFQTEYFTIYYF